MVQRHEIPVEREQEFISLSDPLGQIRREHRFAGFFLMDEREGLFVVPVCKRPAGIALRPDIARALEDELVLAFQRAV